MNLEGALDAFGLPDVVALLAGTGISFGMYVGKTPERATEVVGMEGDTIITQDIVVYAITGEDAVNAWEMEEAVRVFDDNIRRGGRFYELSSSVA